MTTATARAVATKAGQQAAIYCRISHDKDDKQEGVDRQEQICREIVERLGLDLQPQHVYIDNNRSAWQRARKRPGWDAMIAAAGRGEFAHIVAYHPDRLMRQPHDLEQLLTAAQQYGVRLHGQAGGRDLGNPDDVFILRIEVAHACRSSDDTSRRLKDALKEKAELGLAHGGKRCFGYEPGNTVIRESEAEIVREVFDRFLRGEGVRPIALLLRGRGVKTAMGKEWQEGTVRALLKGGHLAGYRMHHGEIVARGTWQAIIDENTWREVQVMLGQRSVAYLEGKPAHRFYVLRGLVVCSRCGNQMYGAAAGGGYRTYVCSGRKTGCKLRISAASLEAEVAAWTIELLKRIDVTGAELAAAATDARAAQRLAELEEEQDELMGLWKAEQLSLKDFVTMKKEVERKIAEVNKRAIVRPVKALLGATGRDAGEKWHEHEPERQRAIMRCLIEGIVIGPTSLPPGQFDISRVKIVRRSL